MRTKLIASLLVLVALMGSAEDGQVQALQISNSSHHKKETKTHMKESKATKNEPHPNNNSTKATSTVA